MQENKQGMKFDQNKLRWWLLPVEPIQEVIKVLMHGSQKYADFNWQKVADAEERYWSAAVRHIMAERSGEERDPETGLLHVSHATTCLIFLAWFKLTGEKK